MVFSESFDNPTKYIWSKAEFPGLVTADFLINNTRYIVSFAGHYFISISFELTGRGQGIYGTGSAVTIFSTVIAIVREYVNSHHPVAFGFEAKRNQPSRVKLYKRLTEKLKDEVQGYKIDIDDDGGPEIFFAFYGPKWNHA